MSLAQQFLAARAEHKRDKPRNRGKQTVTPTANQPLDVPTSDPLYGVAPIREQRFPAQGVGSANVVRRRLGDRTGMLPEFDAEAEMRASGLMPRDDSWLPEHWRGMEGGGELPPANPAPSLRSPTPAPAWEVASGLEPAEQFERSVPLDRESLARFAGESAALQVQPSFGDGNILDVFRGYGEGAWDAGADTISALGGNEGAQRRMNARGQWFGRAAQNGFGVPDALEGIGAAMTSSGMLDDPSNPNFIPSSQFHRWDVDRADLAMDREAENDPRYLGRAEEFVVEVPRYRGVEGAARFAGSMVDDWLGAGAFERDAEGRRRYATADAMGDLAADRGDVEGATQWDQEAQSAAGAQAFDAGFNALELAPGIGLIDVPISAGRFTGRQVARGLGREVPNVLQAPLPDVPGPLTQEGRRYVGRNLVEPAVGAGAGYALMQTGDGDAEPWAVGLGTAAGALTPGALRLGARAIGDELAAQAAAPPIDRARRMPDYPAGTRLEVRDVPFEEVAPSRQRNFEAAVQDPASLRADRARPVSYGELTNVGAEDFITPYERTLLEQASTPIERAQNRWGIDDPILRGPALDISPDDILPRRAGFGRRLGEQDPIPLTMPNEDRYLFGRPEIRGTSRETASVPLDAGTNQLAEQRLNSAGNRRGVYDNNLRNGDRNAQIVDLREQFGRNAQADGGRGRRAEGSADHIAAVMRGEQPLPDGSFIETPRPEVTRSTVLGVWKRADDAARAAAPPEEAFRGLEEFGISPERARAISAQRNTDPLAIGALALGTGALALGAGEADAQGLERLDIDPDAAPPSMRSAVGSPTVYGEYYIQEFADGSRHVFRMNRQGERADPEYVGELRGTNTPSPRLGEGQGRVISEGVLETPLPPYEGEDNGEETPLWMRAIGAGVAGLTGRKITTALGGRGVLRDLNTALSAGLGDFAITGGDADPRDSLGVGLMTAGGARAFDAIAPEVAAVGRSYVREAELAASPAFRAERDAFAETLSDQPQSRVRALGGLERDPFDHYQYGEIEGVGGMVPGSEIIDEGWARDLDSASLGLGGNTGSPREQFLAAAPEEQARMIERARRSEWADPGPELPYVSPERIEQGRAAQRLVASSAPATPPIGPQAGFTEPGTGTSVFGEVKPPRAPRAPLPPLEDRAQLSGAQGAMRGVKAPTMRAMADDLGIARDGMTAGELRKSLTRALAARFDSTRELVAFLTRYGVSGAALGLAFEAERAEAASP